MGVRGIKLGEGDKVISLSILRHVDATADERAAYLKQSRRVRRAATGEERAESADGRGRRRRGERPLELPQERYVEMSAAEQFVLTVSELGYGKRSSSYEYRITGRGGKGIRGDRSRDQDQRKSGSLVASFPVEDGRPDHAGHRRRPAHPHAGRRHPHRRPRDAKA